ncbi:MAG: hypothetical protein ABR981_03635 [Candidatus Micrarchaeaceae archaeon]
MYNALDNNRINRLIINLKDTQSINVAAELWKLINNQLVDKNDRLDIETKQSFKEEIAAVKTDEGYSVDTRNIRVLWGALYVNYLAESSREVSYLLNSKINSSTDNEKRNALVVKNMLFKEDLSFINSLVEEADVEKLVLAEEGWEKCKKTYEFNYHIWKGTEAEYQYKKVEVAVPSTETIADNIRKLGDELANLNAQKGKAQQGMEAIEENKRLIEQQIRAEEERLREAEIVKVEKPSMPISTDILPVPLMFPTEAKEDNDPQDGSESATPIKPSLKDLFTKIVTGSKPLEQQENKVSESAIVPPIIPLREEVRSTKGEIQSNVVAVEGEECTLIPAPSDVPIKQERSRDNGEATKHFEADLNDLLNEIRIDLYNNRAKEASSKINRLYRNDSIIGTYSIDKVRQAVTDLEVKQITMFLDERLIAPAIDMINELRIRDSLPPELEDKIYQKLIGLFKRDREVALLIARKFVEGGTLKEWQKGNYVLELRTQT